MTTLADRYDGLCARAMAARAGYARRSRARRAVALEAIASRAWQGAARCRGSVVEGPTGGGYYLPGGAVTIEPDRWHWERRDSWARAVEARRSTGLRRAARALAVRVTALPADEHGRSSSRGDHYSMVGLDYSPPAAAARYHATPGTALGLVRVDRARVYARSYHHAPSTASQIYLVGTNEAGTGFAHPVAATCTSIRAAVAWIWDGHDSEIVARQGDIALIVAKGPRLPARLPLRHEIDEAAGHIVHPTHPAIPLPCVGQRIIIGRRAADRYIAEGHGD